MSRHEHILPREQSISVTFWRVSRGNELPQRRRSTGIIQQRHQSYLRRQASRYLFSSPDGWKPRNRTNQWQPSFPKAKIRKHPMWGMEALWQLHHACHTYCQEIPRIQVHGWAKSWSAIHTGNGWPPRQRCLVKSSLSLCSFQTIYLSNSNPGFRYLYEIGDYILAVDIVDIAKSVCEDKSSAEFARLCNAQGASFYELNRAADCRSDWEYAFALRQKFLQATPTDIAIIADVGISLHNLGNMEHSAGNYDRALSYYGQAVEIRLRIGDAVAFHITLTYLGIGRCFAAQKKFDEAMRMYAQAEQLFVRTLGAQKYFMAYCH